MPPALVATVIAGWAVIALSVIGWRLGRRDRSARAADPVVVVSPVLRYSPCLTVPAVIAGVTALVATVSWPVAIAGEGGWPERIPEWVWIAVALGVLVAVLVLGWAILVHLPRSVAPAMVRGSPTHLEVVNRLTRRTRRIDWSHPHTTERNWYLVHYPSRRVPSGIAAWVPVRVHLATIVQHGTTVRLSVEDHLLELPVRSGDRRRRPAPWMRRSHVVRDALGVELLRQIDARSAGPAAS